LPANRRSRRIRARDTTPHYRIGGLCPRTQVHGTCAHRGVSRGKGRHGSGGWEWLTRQRSAPSPHPRCRPRDAATHNHRRVFVAGQVQHAACLRQITRYVSGGLSPLTLRVIWLARDDSGGWAPLSVSAAFANEGRPPPSPVKPGDDSCVTPGRSVRRMGRAKRYRSIPGWRLHRRHCERRRSHLSRGRLERWIASSHELLAMPGHALAFSRQVGWLSEAMPINCRLARCGRREGLNPILRAG